MKVEEITEQVLEGRMPDRETAGQLVHAPLEPLLEGADRLRKKYSGDRVELCTILNGRSGLCGENCRFCAQAACHHTDCDRYELLPEDKILEAARENEEEGVGRFAVVTSGRSPLPADFERLLKAFTRMHARLGISLCASLGFLTPDQFVRLKAAGVERYHCNIETSRRFFPKICTSHTFEDKIENIKNARAAGLTVCSGGILGMGEDWEDRVDMAFTLRELEVDSIPLNSLMPIPGTPLGDRPRLTEEEILRTIAIFRFICPKAGIRFAGGRALMEDKGRRAFLSGASATITGNMLTTSGSTIRMDKEMLTALGRDVKPVWKTGDLKDRSVLF